MADALKTALETALQSQEDTARSGQIEIYLDGKAILVASAKIESRTVIVRGGWLKTAVVQDEELVEGETVTNPDAFVSKVKGTMLNADIFTFVQKLPDTKPKFPYYVEWDNVAAIPMTTFANWWEKRAKHDVRAAVRKAAKAGVVVKLEPFDDAFVKGIGSIYNETPIRQGRLFWHFQKSFDEVKRINSTYAERNVFLGAYCQDELIGFLRLICANRIAVVMQLLSKKRYSKKKPNNALIAKAVEVCEQRGIRYLTYGNFIYNDLKSSLTEFKRRNGFEPVLLPRYYIPLSRKGRIALKLGLHHEIAHFIPKTLLRYLLRIRSHWYALRWGPLTSVRHEDTV